MQRLERFHSTKHLLSFVIPTLFREKELEDCLDSLLSQVADCYFDIIIVSPVNVSTAEGVLTKYRDLGLDIDFCSSGRVSSVASDLLIGIERATGSYCWFLSDDDIVHPGAIGFIHEVLTQNENLAGISVGYRGYSKNLRSEVKMPAAFNYMTTDTVTLVSSDALVLKAGMHLGFLSAHIISKEALDDEVRTLINSPDVHSNYWIVAQLISIASRGRAWRLIDKPLIGCRTGNDSFEDSLGRLKRFELSYIEFENCISDNFDVSLSALRHMRRVIFWSRLLRTLIKMRVFGMTKVEKKIVNNIIKTRYHTVWASKLLVPVLLMVPSIFYKFVIQIALGRRKWLDLISR